MEASTPRLPEYIEDLKVILGSHSALVDAKKSLHVLFNTTNYGCEKDYPVAVVHEQSRIKEENALAYFKANFLLDDEGFSFPDYPQDDLVNLAYHMPKYIQRVGYIVGQNKKIPEPTFSNKFKHDYWKKLQSVEGLEAVIDISPVSTDTSACEIEDTLRAIIRKRKEVHQLKKIAFVWIVEISGENENISTVMKHYFEENVMIVKNARKTYYMGWSAPLQDINMRYFVCPPE